MTALPAAIIREDVLAAFPIRPRNSHKGHFGTVAVIGGASGMVGAPLLAGRAALKMGAGCVHVGLLADQAPAFDPMQPELMLHQADAALRLTGITVLALGCGLGRSPTSQQLLADAIRHPAALVLDADALNLLADQPVLAASLRTRQAPTVLTPHPGEAARLLGVESSEVQADRIAALRELARKFGGSIVLKGADSLIATSAGNIHCNQTGNPGMSAAGMGDVLTGMVAAFLAQRMDADAALLLAVYLHGAAGDELAHHQGMIGISATEVTASARQLLNQWMRP